MPIMYWQLKLCIIIYLLFHCTEASSHLQQLDSLRHQFQTVDELPKFNIDVIKTPKCREDMQHWLVSLNNFINSMSLDCGNDTDCIDYKTRMSTANMFAAQQIDAFGRIPSGLLTMNTLWQGSWEECLSVVSPQEASYETQFCWQKLATPITLLASGESTFTPEICLSQSISSWSTCMPKSCTDEDITALFQSLNPTTSNNSLYLFCDNECRPTGPPKKKAGFWVMIIILGVTGVVMIASTLFDYLTDYPDGRYKKLRSGTGMLCFLAFSMYTNGSQILSVEKRPGQIECLHCIRVFSMTWVTIGHVYMQYLYSDDLLQLMHENQNFLTLAFTNAFFSVDTFLFVGGLLLTFLFIKDIDRRPSNLKSGPYWILYYLHRILRLSPPYWLWLGFTIVFFDFLTPGPTKMSIITSTMGCHKSWWRNILYINNLFDLENLCMGHSWYLALDMQIHVFAPLFLVPLALHYLGGIASGVILIAVSTAMNYWAYYKWDLPATMMGFFTGAGTVDFAKTTYFQQYIYFASWIRYTPYIIGGWTGYFLYILRKHNIKLKSKLHWLIVVVLWICATLIAIACVYGLFDYVRNKELNTFTRASYYNWSRIGWSLSLAWVVIACEHNIAGPIKDFMEQQLWAPFSRLTYCAYLVHFILISVVFAMARQPLHFVNVMHVYIVGGLPVFVLSYVVAFIWSCAYEMPALKLEKMFIAACFGNVGRHRTNREQKEVEAKIENKVKAVAAAENGAYAEIKDAESGKDKISDGLKADDTKLPSNDAEGYLISRSSAAKPKIAPKPRVFVNSDVSMAKNDGDDKMQEKL